MAKFSLVKATVAASVFGTCVAISGQPMITVAADESAITSGLLNLGRSKYHSEDESSAVEGSVVPELAMEEQIKPCQMSGDTTRVLVNVSGIKSDSGNVRVAIYGNNPDEFLVSGKAISRVDVPSRAGEMKLCVELPAAGEYSMAVLHDANANGRAEIFSEGFGFSNNPSIGFSVPDYDDVAFKTGAGVQEMQVALNYVFGNEQKDRRRRSRR